MKTSAAALVARPPLAWTLILCTAIFIARRPDLLQAPQFWAEDGPVFFLQSRTLGADALFTPSAGYLHTVLRLIAWLAALVDPTLSPALYCAAAAGCTLYVAARTQSSRFPLPPSIGYALAVVTVPDAFEVLLTLTNLQWILAGGLLLVLIAREPESPRQCAHDAAAVALLGLTGPFVIVGAPLFAWRAWYRKTGFSFALAAIAGAAAAIQLTLIIRYSLGDTAQSIAAETLLAVPGMRVGASLLTGGRLGAMAGVPVGTAWGVATLAVIAAMALRRDEARLERIWLALAFVGLLAAALYRCRQVLPDVFHGAGSRYFFPLQLIALWLVVATASAQRAWSSRAALVALAIIVVLNVPRLREPAFTDHNWAHYVAKIRQGEAVTVRINPDWEFEVPGVGPRQTLLAGQVAKP